MKGLASNDVNPLLFVVCTKPNDSRSFRSHPFIRLFLSTILPFFRHELTPEKSIMYPYTFKIFLFVIAASSVLSQQPAHLQFYEKEPTWNYVLKDESHNYSDTLNIERTSLNSCSNHLIIHEENYAYLLRRCLSNYYGIYGGIVSKVDIVSGEILWEKYLTKYSGNEFQEVYREIRIEEDNTIGLYGFRNPEEEPTTGFKWRARGKYNPIKYKIDKFTGQTISTFESEVEEGLFNDVSFPDQTIHLDQNNDQYLITDEFSNYNHAVEIRKIKDQIKIEDTIKVLPFIPKYELTLPSIQRGPRDLYSVNDSMVVLINSLIYGDTTVNKNVLLFRFLNSNKGFEVTKSLDLGYLIKTPLWSKGLANFIKIKDGFLYTLLHVDDAFTAMVFHFDSEGNLLNYLPEMKYEEHYYGHINVIKETEEDLFLMASESIKAMSDDRVGNDILRLSKSNGNIEYLSSLTTSETDFVGMPRFATFENRTLMSIPFLPQTTHLAGFNFSDLLLPTSTKNVKSTDEVTFSPNPVSNILYIGGVERHQISKIVITDVTGQMVKAFDKIHGEINVSDFKAGVYFITVLSSSEDRIAYTHRFIKV